MGTRSFPQNWRVGRVGRRFPGSTKAPTAGVGAIGRVFALSTNGPRHQFQGRPPEHQNVFLVDCYVGSCGWGCSERVGGSLLTLYGSRASLSMTSMTATRPTIAAPKMDAVKPPALHIACHMLACPTHHEVCAFYWVPMCMRLCHGRRSSAVADQF